MEEESIVDKMLYSYSFKFILDFLSAPDLLKIQMLNRHMYDKLVP